MTEKLELKGSRGSQGDQTSESDGPIDSMEPLSDAVIDSMEPLTRNEKLKELEANKNIYIKIQEKDSFKDSLSFALSVFNLMNAILGSGILGLADTLKNLGIIPFLCLLVFTSILASYTINMLLHMSELTNLKSFEQMSLRCFGVPGKMITCCIIILHCLGALCSYVFIMKEELPEFVKSVMNVEHSNNAWYLSGEFLMILVVCIVIVPLASLKNIRFLGYSSAFGMACMLMFTFTVIVKKFEIPCPLENTTNSHEIHNTTDEEQFCEPEMYSFSLKSAFALPTMFFSFMCHASMLPIYAELRRPSIAKMQKVANVSITLVFILYSTSALFGYLTFFNRVKAELLLTYSEYNPKDTVILIARAMVITCVTLSAPLLHYPARKTVILTFCESPHEHRWGRHLLVMAGFITTTVIFVVSCKDIRTIFGYAGSTTSTTLLTILPSLFVIKLTGKEATPSVQRRYYKRRIFAYFLATFGVVFMFTSTASMIVSQLQKK